MSELFKLIKQFEKRNNISIFVTIYSDKSSSVYEFWQEENLFNAKSEIALINFLKNIKYELDENGKCFSPVRIKKTKI